MKTGICKNNYKTPLSLPLPTPKSIGPINSPPPAALRLQVFTFPGSAVCGSSSSSRRRAITAVDGRARGHASVTAWDEKPFEILSNGKKAYVDELDILTFIHPPKDLIPFDPTSYNPAAYLWKKIGDLPEERRQRLLQLLNPSLISRAWEIAATRYGGDPKLLRESTMNLPSNKDGEFYNCRMSGGPWPIAWINFFKKAIFCGSNGKRYGRFIGGSIMAQFANRLSPLYFEVTQLKEIMPTEEPCDLAYEFGDGLLDLHECPVAYPKPAKHPHPFSDHVVIYIRHIGPGVLVGQAWQEGKKLDQVPRKLCGEILMVKDYAASREN